MSTEDETWPPIRVKKSVHEDIQLILKRNPAFESAGQVIEFAIRKLLEKGSK